jgi:D-alanyl-D-alanine carboxypeptidase/D-alanyl-D-alanine-endopeptidase (penicillin-binding protein 4)
MPSISSSAFRLACCSVGGLLLLMAFGMPWPVPADGRTAAPGAHSDAASVSSEAASLTAPRPPDSLTDRLADRLADRINPLLDRRTARSAFWGVHVIDLASGETLYARNPDKAFLPASNQKLLTSATALDALGATYRYKTTLHFDGAATDSTLSGDFVIKGSGDPTFGSLALRGTDPLATWAERLVEMGVTRVEGRLIADASRFNGRPYPEGWDVDYITRQSGRSMGASAGALSYRDNVVAVRIAAARPGAPPTVETRPAEAVAIQNNATTSSRRRGSSLQVNRAFDTNQLVLTGSVPRYYRGTVNVPVSDPAQFTLRNWVQRLTDAGIEADLTLHAHDDVPGAASMDAPLFVHLSPPLSEILAVMNKESDNFYAEQIFRTYGWGGSVRGASRRTETLLRRAGVDTRRVLIRDGSGLSRKDLITPRAMASLLAHMNEHEAREAFWMSLPQGGENNTTLEYRLHREAVWAKTGSLRFVRALSGYAERPDGGQVAFAVFANNYTGPSYQISRVIDEVVQALTSTSVR